MMNNTSVLVEKTAFENEELIDPSKPLVFQCASCNVVLGDSMAWVCANSELRTVTLCRLSDHVQREDALLTSQAKADLGSTYNMLSCSSCKKSVGRIYKTTSKQLDKIRDLYSLDFDLITMYQLGGKPVETALSEDLLSHPSFDVLAEEVKKIKRLMVVLNNRMVTVEEALEINSNRDEQTADPQIRPNVNTSRIFPPGGNHGSCLKTNDHDMPVQDSNEISTIKMTQGNSQLEGIQVKRKSVDSDVLSQKLKKKRK